MGRCANAVVESNPAARMASTDALLEKWPLNDIETLSFCVGFFWAETRLPGRGRTQPVIRGGLDWLPLRQGANVSAADLQAPAVPWFRRMKLSATRVRTGPAIDTPRALS